MTILLLLLEKVVLLLLLLSFLANSRQLRVQLSLHVVEVTHSSSTRVC
jgi:hypothetical protein